ncbi:hypothetical protein V2J09_011467 [Rumex salicifolius]
MGGDAIAHQQMVVDLQEAFGFFDIINGDGRITAEALATVMREFDGAVEFQELFKIMAAKLQESADTEEELKEAFKVFDKDQNGFISPTELRQVMMNLGEKLTDEEVEQMITEADLDGDGLVNYDEFVKMMTSSPLRFGF